MVLALRVKAFSETPKIFGKGNTGFGFSVFLSNRDIRYGCYYLIMIIVTISQM